MNRRLKMAVVNDLSEEFELFEHGLEIRCSCDGLGAFRHLVLLVIWI